MFSDRVVYMLGGLVVAAWIAVIVLLWSYPIIRSIN